MHDRRAGARVDVLAAFIQDSGLTLVQGPLQNALRRGAAVRILTGDYLDLTQAHALRRLLDATGLTRGDPSDRLERDPSDGARRPALATTGADVVITAMGGYS